MEKMAMRSAGRRYAAVAALILVIAAVAAGIAFQAHTRVVTQVSRITVTQHRG